MKNVRLWSTLTLVMLTMSLVMPLVDDTTIDDAGDILAPPGLDVGPSIPGVPSFIFE